MEREGTLDKPRVRKDDLRNLVRRTLESLGVPPEEGAVVADVLVAADLRGIPSHGVSRLPLYARRLRDGKIEPRTSLVVLRETTTTLVLDAGQGWGHVAGREAMRRCIEKARSTGISVATVRRSTHYGIAAYYAMMALDYGMIGATATNSRPHAAPTYGRTPVLGTNPLAFAVPANEELPFVLDMATSVVAMGRVKMRESLGHPIPLGWGIDETGAMTDETAAVARRGALLPLGGLAETSGYKGYGLAFLVDILSGVLAGAGFGPMMAQEYETTGPDIGHVFAALDVEAFRPAKEFRCEVDQLIREIRSSPRLPGASRIYVPGEKESECAEENAVRGIPIAPETLGMLKDEAEWCGVPFDLRPIQSGPRRTPGRRED